MESPQPLSPELTRKIVEVMGELIQEKGLGPGSYLVIVKADAHLQPADTIIGCDWWWHPHWNPDVPLEDEIVIPDAVPDEWNTPPG